MKKTFMGALFLLVLAGSLGSFSRKASADSNEQWVEKIAAQAASVQGQPPVCQCPSAIIHKYNSEFYYDSDEAARSALHNTVEELRSGGLRVLEAVVRQQTDAHGNPEGRWFYRLVFVSGTR